MKTLLTIIAFYITGPALGQIDYQIITPKDLDARILHEVSVSKDLNAVRQIVREVIASERQETIAHCFQNALSRSYTLKQVAEMPKRANRLRAAITLLRTSSGYWPDDNNPGGGFTSITITPGHLLVEPFISTVAELLPQEKLELHHMISTMERVKLADRLEEALEKKHPTDKPSTPVMLTPVGSAPAKPPPATPSLVPKSAAKPQLVTAVTTPVQESESNGQHVFWIPIIGAVAVGLWVLLRKKA